MVSSIFWENVSKQHKNVDLSNERVSSDISHGYQFDVEAISSHSYLTDHGAFNVQHEIRLSLFDALHRRFVGQTWRNHPVLFDVDSVAQPSRLLIKQPVYFHTTILDSSLLMVVELVLVLTPKNPLPDQPSQPRKQSAGWSAMRLFTGGQAIKNSFEKRESGVKKLDLFQGSPRALLFADDPIEKNSNIKLIPGCQLFVHFLKHPPLELVAHLIPENRIVSASDRVPGVLDHYVMTDAGKDYYLKAKPIPPSPCSIDNLSLDLGQPLDKFEAELCDVVNSELMGVHTVEGVRGLVVTARGLRVGVHNGYGYVQKPQFVEVEPDAGDAAARASSGQRPAKSASMAHVGDSLVARSRLRLDELIADPGVVLCFHLEYTFGFPNFNPVLHGTRGSILSQSQTIMARWTWWPPLSNFKEQTVTCQLKGGVGVNPDKEYFYQLQVDPEMPTNTGFIRFNFLVLNPVPSQVRPAEQILKSSSMVQDKDTLFSRSQPPDLPHQYLSPDLEAPRLGSTSHTQFPLQPTVNVEISHLEMEDYASPLHAHPINPISKHKAPLLSRAMQARIHASHVPDIVDRNGAPPHSVDPLDPSFKFELPLNITDTLQTNRIYFQFLAFTPPSTAPFEPLSQKVNSLFFSFHFFRFQPIATQRVGLMKAPSVDGYQGNTETNILRKIEAGEKLDEGPAGLELIYHIDPEELRQGEGVVLLSYLASHHLFIDVWDGDSLMLLGTVCLPLKHLLRGRKEAVCADHQLDVVLSEHSDVSPTFTGDLSTGGRVRPLGMRALHRGKLYIRTANVGFPSRCKAPTSWSRNPLVVADFSGRGFFGGSVSSACKANEGGARSPCFIKRLPDCDLELANLVLVNKGARDWDKSEDNTAQGGEERTRKLSRMRFLRSKELDNPKRVTMGHKALLERHDRALKEQDLLAIHDYRERTKAERILDVLTLSITTHYTVRATLGVAEYLELELRNPFPTPQTVTVECNSADLRVVVEAREWKHFKKMSGLQTPLEEEMFALSDDGGLPQVYLRPKETVYIPFRYQSYMADHQVALQGPSHCKTTPTSIQPIKWKYTENDVNPVKAVIRASDGKPFSILQLHVLHQPPLITQTLRFYNPEQSFLKKCIRLPPFGASKDAQFHAVCSDAEVVCQSVSRGNDEPREVYLKVACGESPSIRKFYLCLYNDPFLVSPAQTWLIYVHALQRMDVECVMGQTSRLTIALRGTQSVRNVQCFPSHPSEIQVSPAGAFLLGANSVNEVHVGVRTTSPHKSARHMYVNVVDTEFHQLVRTWLVAVRTREPIVSKEFTIELPRSGSRGNAKMIAYTNPYQSSKQFRLLTNRPDLLQFRENVVELLPGEKTTFGLRFATGVAGVGKFPVYVFINDNDDKNEETFLINVVYE